MFLRLSLATVLVCALGVLPATAQDVPRVVSFSGVADGNSPLSKPVSVTIAIYDDASATTPVFAETHLVTLGQQRQFDVLLGSATGGGLPESLFANNAARYIGVQVAGLPEQTPRIMVVSVPYALKSADADKLGGLPASEYLTEFDPSSANAYTDAQVAAEAAARAAADTTLQSNIDAEAAARAQGDIDTLAAANTYTDSSVAAEAAARSAADTTLQSNIDAEAAARAQGDIDTLAAANTYTDSSVAAEAAARSAADTTLQSNIDAEAAARAQGDIDTLAAANTYTDSSVAAEAAARSAADTTLQSNIDAEAAARALGDVNTLAAANTYTDSSVAAEAAARSAADTTLQSNIDAVAGSSISSLSAGTGISISGSGGSRTIANTGDTTAGDDITSLIAGAGLSVSGSGNSRTISNTGDLNSFDDITNLMAGTGISISGSGGSRTIAVNTTALNGATFGNGGAGPFIFDSAGGVGIGTVSPGQALDVVGNVRGDCFMATGGGAFGTCSSDARLKTGVRPFSGLLGKVTALQPMSFDWNPTKASALGLSGRSFGLIAQDVEKVLPEMVTSDGPGGYKAVRYDMLPMLLLQSLRELKEENDTLKRALAEQDARMKAIEAAIKR